MLDIAMQVLVTAVFAALLLIALSAGQDPRQM